MNLHEYQSKVLFAKFGIPTPKGKVAFTADEVYAIAQEIGGPVVVKSQVLVGGRGKAGGIKVVKTAEEARDAAEKILNKLEIKGLLVRKVLVDPASPPASEIYLGITNDRTTGKPLLMASSEGGVEIEEVNRTNPQAIIREYINPAFGLHDYQTKNVASAINLPREHWDAFSKIALNLWRCYVANDAVLAEINPLAITQDNQLLALDGKMVIDDNALYRHQDLVGLRDTDSEPKSETQAREAGISYVQLEGGQIGCMVNGAGLAMTTMDMIMLYGGGEYGPANFLDVGGGAQADKVAAALRIILSDGNIKSILVNIFGGITRCDEVARGMLQAYDEVKPEVGIVIRLQGTNAKEGREIIDNAKIPRLVTAATLTEAAQKSVAAAKGEI